MAEKNVPKDEPEKDITDQLDSSNTSPIQSESERVVSSEEPPPWEQEGIYSSYESRVVSMEEPPPWEQEGIYSSYEMSRMRESRMIYSPWEQEGIYSSYESRMIYSSYESRMMMEMMEMSRPELSTALLSSRMSGSHSVGVPFPDSDVIKDNLHGAQIVAENRLLLKGNSPQSLDWSDYGFKMHFPQDTLPPHDTCEVAVLALIGGNFQIPEGTELVSAIFSVSFAKEVNRPVQVEIEHCVELTSQNDADEMIFVATDSGSLGVLFKAVDEAKFIPHNKYGIINKLHFCRRKMGAVQKKTQQPKPYSRKYFGCLFYQTIELNHWTVEFTVIKAIKTHMQALMEIQRNAEAKPTSIKFKFTDDHIELVVSKRAPNGWRLDPDREPLILLKSEVDDYVKLPLLYRPSCRITVYGEQTANEPQLHHPIELNGIECKTKKIFINLCMTTHNLSVKSSSAAGAQGGVDATILQPTDENFIAVLTETKDITDDWSILSIILGVAKADVECIKSDNRGKTFNQQQAFVMAWLNKGKASWESLATALRHDLVKKGGYADMIERRHPRHTEV